MVMLVYTLEMDFASALPARGASAMDWYLLMDSVLCLGAACTGCIVRHSSSSKHFPSLPRRCLHGVHRSAIVEVGAWMTFASALPARGASRYTSIPALARFFASALPARGASPIVIFVKPCSNFASALPARGASRPRSTDRADRATLPRRCLHGVHHAYLNTGALASFASALPARGASAKVDKLRHTIL